MTTVGYCGADVSIAVDAPPSETIEILRCLRVSRTLPSRATLGIESGSTPTPRGFGRGRPHRRELIGAPCAVSAGGRA